MLTKAEMREAKKYASGCWAVLRYDAETGITTWVKREDDKTIRFMETQDASQIVDENAYLRASWEGWSGKKHGAVVARIPIVEDNALKIRCGYDGAEYDKKKYNALLNDIQTQATEARRQAERDESRTRIQAGVEQIPSDKNPRGWNGGPGSFAGVCILIT